MDPFKRPGIDDVPDPDEVLSDEDKESIGRLAVPMPEGRPPEASATQPEVQAARMVADAAAAPAAPAVAAIDAAVPDKNSAFLDMRDPMVSADGHRPTKVEIVRLGIGFTVSAVVCAIPWTALGQLALPQMLDQIDPGSRESIIALINGLGSVVALLANVVFGTFSDLTRSRFGRRTPWIIGGGLLTGLCVLGVAYSSSVPLIVFLWCMMQLGYNIMLAPFVATMSDRIPDKFRGTVSGFYGAGIAVGQTLGSLVGSQLVGNVFGSFLMGALVFGSIGIITVVIWPREKSSRELPREQFSLRMIVKSFTPPLHAPDFYYALFGRTAMMAGYNMVTMYQLYICKYYVLKDSGLKGDALTHSAAGIIATMSVITLVVSLVAALIAGPISDRLGMRKVPVALASCLYAVGVAMPWIFPSAMGMYLFAGIAGFGYGIYNAIDQALNVAVLPNPDEAGKDLGILNLANTLCSVIGSTLASVIVIASGKNYMWIFPAGIVLVLIAAVLIMRIKHVK